MKRNVLHFTFVSTLLTAYSCSQDVETIMQEETNTITNPHRVSSEQAKANALEFINSFSVKTRGSELQLSADAIHVDAYTWNTTGTRSTLSYPHVNDTLFYIINLGNDEGFLLASADDRRTPVMAYIEEGSYHGEPDDNPGFNLVLDNLIDMCLREPDATESNDKPATRVASNVTEIMYPLLKTKWNQITSSTYGMYCPNGIAGCVPVAYAQICSYLEFPDYFTFSGSNIYLDWSQINSYCEAQSGSVEGDPTLLSNIALFLRFLGSAFGAEYNASETSVDPDDAVEVMQNWGVDMPSLRSFNSAYIAEDLSRGNRIVITRGNSGYYHVGFFFRKYTGGHSWVTDGYLRATESGNSKLFLHTNWGWGGRGNGYYWSELLEPTDTPPYNDLGNARTYNAGAFGNQYKYNLQHCTIVKH